MKPFKNIILIIYLIIVSIAFYFIAQYKWSALFFIASFWIFFKLKKKLDNGSI